MNFKLKLLNVLLLLVIAVDSHATNNCGINFVKYVQGEMPADITKNPAVNMWDERFNVDQVVKYLSTHSKTEVAKYIDDLVKLVHKDKTFNNNLSLLVTNLYQERILNFAFIKRKFLKRDFNHTSFYFSKTRMELSAQVNITPEKLSVVKSFVKSQKDLSDFYKSEYIKALLQSNRSHEDIAFAIDHGMKLRGNAKDLEQFKKYLEFLDNAKEHHINKGLQDIEKIYQYSYKSKLPYNPYLPIYKRFLAQSMKVEKYQAKRIREIERGLKLQHKNGLIDEIDEAVQREANGIKVHVAEKLRFRKKIDEMEIPSAMKQRAAMQAKHEANIYRRMLNGCNSGNSQRIESAAKKFSRFKFALALGVSPAFYIVKNKDKMESDQFFWEKLGHEVAMGVLFTWVGNKIFTNTKSTFWGKYWEGQWKFGPLSYLEAYSYEELFGTNSYMTHIQALYKDNSGKTKVEEEYERLVNSPTFDKDVKEMISYLEEQSKKRNTINFLDKYFNLTTYSSVDDDFRITQEDLESEEAREMMMELIAERIYLENMGQWAFFQTGRKDTDRTLFYRARSLVWDIKGLALNLAIFEMMCREPFGKIGSWGAILALVFGDQYLTNDLTYGYRREMINQ